MPSPRMILGDVLTEMRKYGMSMSKSTLVSNIRERVFPFITYTADGYFIMRKDFENWANDYLLPFADSDGRAAE